MHCYHFCAPAALRAFFVAAAFLASMGGVVRMSSSIVWPVLQDVYSSFASLWAAKMLCALGLGMLAVTAKSDAGGKPGWFFVKRIVCAKTAMVLRAMGCSAASTPTLETYTATVAADTSLPLRATAVDWTLHDFPPKAVSMFSFCFCELIDETGLNVICSFPFHSPCAC